MKSVIDILKENKIDYSINYLNSITGKYDILVIEKKSFTDLKNKVKDIRKKHFLIEVKELQEFTSIKHFI